MTQTLETAADTSTSWTDFYVENGYAVVKGLVDRSFCDAALARVRELTGNDRPIEEWSTENTPVWHRPYFQGGSAPDPVFGRLFEQRRLLDAIDALFGAPRAWNGMHNYYLFLKPHDPKATAQLSPRGHIDFPDQGVPPLYRGFTYQVLLADNEPFSGNLTLYPGTHKDVQRLVLEDPEMRFKNGMHERVRRVEPYEFVGEAGDVCFMHHLVLHAGNNSHAAGRRPRVALHAEAFRDEWLTEVDPSRPGLSPWERSLAHNGPIRTTPELEAVNMKKRRDYVESLRNKDPEQAARAY